MRIIRPSLKHTALAALTLFMATLATEVMAPPMGGPPGGFRPPTGRMHHNRIGPASGGSFTSATRPPVRIARPPPAAAVRKHRELGAAIREHQVDHREQARATVEINQEAIREAEEVRREEYWDRWRARENLGTVYTERDFSSEECEVSAVVEGVTYYNCDGVWYERAFSGGTVTYVVVERPRRDES